MPKRRYKIIKTAESFQSEIIDFDYTLSRSCGRRTLSIGIDEQARVQVSVPFRTPLQEIHAFLTEKAAWIEKCIRMAKANQEVLSEKKYEHGAQFLFLGKKFPLSVAEDNLKRSRIEFDSQGWRISLPQGLGNKAELVQQKLRQWYKTQAQEILGAKAFQFARDIGVAPKSIQIRNQKRLWGCCDWNKQSITLNWQIILAPIPVVDYVIIHELCHLIHPNHGKRFWNKVGKYMPHYQENRKWLRDNQIELMLPI